MGTILYGEIIDEDLWDTNYRDMFRSLFASHKQIFGVLLLMLLIVVCLGFFIGFHLYLSCQNMTTNGSNATRAKKHQKTDRKQQESKIEAER